MKARTAAHQTIGVMQSAERAGVLRKNAKNSTFASHAKYISNDEADASKPSQHLRCQIRPSRRSIKASMPRASLLAIVVAVATASAAPIPDKIPPKVQPFALTEVRLLDGPFKQAMQLDGQYLLSLDPDRLLHTFRVNAGLPSTATPLGGWEAPDVELRGHTVGHYLSALALMYAATGDQRFKSRADAMVAELAKVQEAEARRFHPGYLSAFPEEFFDRLEARQKVWAPYYTIHKIMAGLLDVSRFCGNAQAFDVVTKMADWVKFRVDKISEQKQQAALGTEFGGMNEVLANLYAATGNPEYLRVACAFNHKAIFEPLLRHEDPLNGLHANTQFPKIIGASRQYELTGDESLRNIATFFWDRVVYHRTYVMGGNSDGEHFFPEEEFSKHLSADGPETCNTYNMLKLTRHIYEWSADPAMMDFYERALFNHILPSQDPRSGMVIYYCPLRPAAWKSFSTPENSFWCCVGTGMENHATYGDSIYFHDDRSLYVNLFISSEVKWKDKNVTVHQQTRFPEQEKTHLWISAPQPVRMTLKIRHPAWADSGFNVFVNGRPVPASGSYVSIDREWKNEDRIDVFMPMRLHIEAMPDDPRMVAILYGPMVLAGDLGNEGMDSVKHYGPYSAQMGRLVTPVIPALVSEKDLTEKIVPDGTTALQFRTKDLGQPHDVTLMPLYRIVDQRFTVYWDAFTPAQWEARKKELGRLEAHREEVARRSIDAVNVNDAASESAHRLQSEKTNDTYFEGRRTRQGKEFSYQMLVLPDRPTSLVCTYPGRQNYPSDFDILVDGQKVATEKLEEYNADQRLDREYDIPQELTRGKSHVTVRLQAHSDSAAGALIEMRTIAR
jgi:DUF1680 family protein